MKLKFMKFMKLNEIHDYGVLISVPGTFDLLTSRFRWEILGWMGTQTLGVAFRETHCISSIELSDVHYCWITAYQ